MSKFYVLTDDILTPSDTLKSQILEILNSGVKFIQYRSKAKEQNLSQISEICKLCLDFGANFIINDDPLLAQKVGASGVHLGKDDIKFELAREILGKDKIIGVSCYNDLNLAIKAQNLGADYIAFGSVFPSKTKKEAKICDFETIKQAKKLDTQICLIGGINASNLQEIKPLNPDLIAIVSAAYEPLSISENLANLNQILRK